MKTGFKLPIHLIFLYLIFAQSISAQVVHRLTADRYTHYQISDWISYATALEVTSVEIDLDYVYFGTRQGGILRYDKYTNRWAFPYTTSSGLRSNVIIQVVYNPDNGFLYALTAAGIDVLMPAEKWWRPAELKQMPRGRLTENFYQKEGNQANRHFYRFPVYSRPANSELPDFFTERFFLYRMDGTLIDRQNREFKLTDRIVDSWQRLWAGSNGYGPVKADLDITVLETMPQSIPHISPRDIYMDGKQVWVAGIGRNGSVGGIAYWDRKNDSWRYFEAQFISRLDKDDVLSIDGNQRYIAFATSLGLSLYDRQKDKWRTFGARHGLNGNQTFDVLVEGDSVFIATEYGLNWLDLLSMKLSEPGELLLDNVQVNQLAFDDTLLWAASRVGLYSIDPWQDEITFHPSRAVIPDYNLTAIEIVGQQLWIANRSGIAYWDRQKDQWHSFPNLALQVEIRDIAYTRNNLWFATDSGLLRYDTKRDYWRLYTERDGLLSDNVFRIDPQNKKLWISTDQGITIFRWQRKGRID